MSLNRLIQTGLREVLNNQSELHDVCLQAGVPAEAEAHIRTALHGMPDAVKAVLNHSAATDCSDETRRTIVRVVHYLLTDVDLVPVGESRTIWGLLDDCYLVWGLIIHLGDWCFLAHAATRREHAVTGRPIRASYVHSRT